MKFLDYFVVNFVREGLFKANDLDEIVDHIKILTIKHNSVFLSRVSFSFVRLNLFVCGIMCQENPSKMIKPH